MRQALERERVDGEQQVAAAQAAVVPRRALRQNRLHHDAARRRAAHRLALLRLDAADHRDAQAACARVALELHDLRQLTYAARARVNNVVLYLVKNN